MARKSRRSSSRKMKHTRKHKTHSRRTHRRSSRRRGGAEGAPVNYHLSGSWPSKMSLGQGADYFKYHEGQHGGGLGYGAFPAAVLDPGLPQALRGPAHIGGIDKAIADVRGLSDAPDSTATVGGRRNRSRRNRNRSRGGSRRNRSRRNRNRNGGSRRRRNNTYTVTVANAKVANAAANTAVANAVKANNAAKVANTAATNAVVNAAATNAAATTGGRNRRNRRRSGGALGFAPFPSSGMLLSSPTAYAQAGLNPEWKTDVAFTDAKIRDTQ
jgi:hypothetical protein